MPAAHVTGLLCTGHGCYSPRPSSTGSQTVFINGQPAHRLGDLWSIHCCNDSCHSGVTVFGSTTVFFDSLPVARIGDPVSCGSFIMQGSLDVFVGG